MVSEIDDSDAEVRQPLTSEDEERFDQSSFWRTFRHGSAVVDGARLHFVSGGEGDPILLLPGWPQSWYAWRHVMPALVRAGRHVIALDPRGMGDSERPLVGYDMKTIVADLHQFLHELGYLDKGPIDVVAHDLGCWMAYAYAADVPSDVKRLCLFEASLPGISAPSSPGVPSADVNLKTWHFAFNRLEDLPELLIEGRERRFLTWLFRSKASRPWAIGSRALDEYVRVNSAPGALRSGFAYYREISSPTGLEQSKARASQKLKVPVVAYGAERGVGEALLETMRMLSNDVKGGVIKRCGHYAPEEASAKVAEIIVRSMATPSLEAPVSVHP